MSKSQHQLVKLVYITTCISSLATVGDTMGALYGEAEIKNLNKGSEVLTPERMHALKSAIESVDILLTALENDYDSLYGELEELMKEI